MGSSETAKDCLFVYLFIYLFVFVFVKELMNSKRVVMYLMGTAAVAAESQWPLPCGGLCSALSEEECGGGF